MQHKNNNNSVESTSRITKATGYDATDDDVNCVGVAADTEINQQQQQQQQHQDNFNAKIIKQTVNSVTIDWNLIEHADVYKIEKYNKKYGGWIEVAWTSTSPATIENLAESFAYRFRIKALSFSEELEAYNELEISEDFVGSTLSPLPTTLCLYRATKKGQQFLVKRLLRRRPSLIVYPAPNGFLPLANAITFGEVCIIDILLSAGASVHIGNTLNKRTPLHLAFYYGRLPVARMLLNKKADIDAMDCNGMTACHFAVDANQVEILKFALENGANMEASDACGWTLLLRAVVMRSNLAILKLLIMNGANTKAVDKLGQSCTDLTRLFHNEEAADYFAKSLRMRDN